jgi:hypothetical protein
MGRFVVGAALLLLATAARAEIFGTTYRSTVWGVEMTLPRGWELSEQSSFPGMLARAVEHKNGARVTLAVQRLRPGENARAFVERNELALSKLGYHLGSAGTHPTGAFLLESMTPDKKKTIRQAYIPRGETVYVLSLAVVANLANVYVRPFDETLRGLTFTIPIPPPPTPAEQIEAPAPEKPTP